MKILSNKKGFTLMELIVVIVILGILVLLAAPRFLGYTADANVASLQSDVKVISDAAFLYNVDNGEFPFKVESGAPAKITSAEVITKITEVTELFVIDDSLLEGTYVNNISGDWADYGITATGEVYHLAGLANKSGVVHFGSGATVAPTPAP